MFINADYRAIVFDQRNHSGLYHFVYADNLGVLALREQTQVEIAMTYLECLFTSGGFSLHERSVGTGKQETLGTALDCHRHTTALTGKRFWRLYKALGALLRRKSLTGQALEIVLGH